MNKYILSLGLLVFCIFPSCSRHDDNVHSLKFEEAENVWILRKAAEHGDAEAQCRLGLMYVMGNKVEVDNQEALKWLKKSAEQGNILAQRNMAAMYGLGVGVKQDSKEEAKWYRKAAEQGDHQAQEMLGYMYFNGQGVPQDHVKACEWFEKAAEQGNTYARDYISIECKDILSPSSPTNNEDRYLNELLMLSNEDRYLNELLMLSIEEAKMYGKSQSNWDDVVKQSQDKQKEIKSYSSKRTITTHEGHKSEQYMSHRIDYNQPNRFFVTQSAQDETLGMLYDQWVSIGLTDYKNIGLWMKTQDPEIDNVNQSFRYENYTEIININKPVYYASYSSQGKQYLFLEYISPIETQSNTFAAGIFKDCNEIESVTCKVYFWIDTIKYVITKISIIYIYNQKPTFSIEQAFGCFNENINVKPPAWLNLEPNDKGELINTNVKIITFDHYECKGR